jgi:CHAT domain
MSNKVKILFLAANPKDTTKLRLDEEIREIQTKIRAAEFRDSFDLVSRWALRPLDLLQAFNEVQPDVVHFSGHGSRNAELVLEDDAGNAKPVSEAALVSLFKNVRDNIRLVLLNACHSQDQAKAISQQVECTVGMTVGIGDEAAIVFASTFYGALAFGRSVGQAFEQGRTALMLEGIPEENTPVLLTRPGVDALTVSFVNRKPVNPVLPPVALEILESAVTNNAPVNLVRYAGGVAVQAGASVFDCGFNLEEAALLEHAVTMLVQVGWLKQTSKEQFHVTHAGYEAAKQFLGRPSQGFLQVKEQMPALIAAIKEALQSEDDRFVREFFVMSKRHSLVGSEKPRFVFYEEDHDNLRGKVDILENHGYVTDVTPGNTPIYRMSEKFVRLVLEHG